MNQVATNTNPFGLSVQRYSERRHRLFSKFDDGIQMDQESLYSVKPEEAALQIAERTKGKTVLDAFCGVGGSAIGFARAGKEVLAIDINPSRIEMARHNAGIYGVSKNISFSVTSAHAAISQWECDSVYLDPPWGGPDYYKKDHFLLSSFDPDPTTIIQLAMAQKKEIVLTVPTNFSFSELASLADTYKTLWSFHERKPLFATVFIEGGNLDDHANGKQLFSNK